MQAQHGQQVLSGRGRLWPPRRCAGGAGSLGPTGLPCPGGASPGRESADTDQLLAAPCNPCPVAAQPRPAPGQRRAAGGTGPGRGAGRAPGSGSPRAGLTWAWARAPPPRRHQPPQLGRRDADPLQLRRHLGAPPPPGGGRTAAGQGQSRRLPRACASAWGDVTRAPGGALLAQTGLPAGQTGRAAGVGSTSPGAPNICPGKRNGCVAKVTCRQIPTSGSLVSPGRATRRTFLFWGGGLKTVLEYSLRAHNILLVSVKPNTCTCTGRQT